jgi:endonuclease YncB( thermonuclease family)
MRRRLLSCCWLPGRGGSEPGVDALRGATLQTLKELAKADPAVRFGLHAQQQPCKVVKVYDGDSVTLAWSRPDGRPCFANCRLFGIDTPELRGTSGEERAKAEACRDALTALALGEMFAFCTRGATGLDKYGRPLVVLTAHPSLSGQRVWSTLAPYAGSLNEWALRELPGCVAYFGGTKGQT